jgi:histidinol-phosphate aminotransferase
VTVALRYIPALADIVPYEPGLPIELVKRRFGLDDVVKLASNEYPLPPFPEVREVVIAAIDRLQRYPDGSSTELREALAVRFGRSPDQVTVGSGTCELLYLLGNALLEKGDEVVFAAPSFTTYRDVIDLHEAKPIAVPLVDFTHDLEAMAAAVTSRTKIVIVCNPNNPTGTYVPAADIARLVESVPDDVLVIVDEAYIEFATAPDADGSLALQQAHDNVIVLRTFSKIYGLCGLRTGYGLCSPELKAAIDKVRQPFNVNLLGQVAAVEALRHQDQVIRRSEVNAELRAYMVDRLRARGRATVPSQANFMLVDMNDLCHPHDQVCGTLLSMGAIVRDGNALGCPGWARVSVGTEDEIEFFLSKLASLEVGLPGDGEGRPI